jgi:hypothetical protein
MPSIYWPYLHSLEPLLLRYYVQSAYFVLAPYGNNRMQSAKKEQRRTPLPQGQSPTVPCSQTIPAVTVQDPRRMWSNTSEGCTAYSVSINPDKWEEFARETTHLSWIIGPKYLTYTLYTLYGVD